ncbi:YcaO-like family protein [Paraburkholderia caledonica]|uniref:Ribosomal protein S12 methylthiotransferase accessory factor n=1 Tax=Paraburkholderia caledonica TaxID=134536 RepID=A0AB73IP56_9BURK|nr:ribosomal protein S12 methylthiotransferase accessory factor [Paraburkholderia caledonica]
MHDSLSMLVSRFDEFGITRLANTTWLDRIGISTHSCVCPGTTDVISVYNGKGVDACQSALSAIMECLERTSALWDTTRIVLDSEANLLRSNKVMIPAEFTEPLRANYASTDTIPWVKAESICGTESYLVPADLAFDGFRPRHLPPSPFKIVTSNGLGAGFSKERALSHALYEVVERDVVSCVELKASFHAAGLLEHVATALGVDRDLIAREFVDDHNAACSVDLSTAPTEILELINRYHLAGIDFHLKQLPSIFKIPVFGACAIEDFGEGGVLAAAGFAAHLDPLTACRAAVLEVAQSRATSLQGAREDYHDKPIKSRIDRLPKSDWLLSPSDEAVSFNSADHRDWHLDSLVELYSKIQAGGLDEIAVVNFEKYPGIFVYRVLIPGAETVHATGGLSRVGHRAKAIVNTRTHTQ